MSLTVGMPSLRVQYMPPADGRSAAARLVAAGLFPTEDAANAHLNRLRSRLERIAPFLTLQRRTWLRRPLDVAESPLPVPDALYIHAEADARENPVQVRILAQMEDDDATRRNLVLVDAQNIHGLAFARAVRAAKGWA